ncbi:MAG: hypothetical protein SFU25_07430 [Candidatus Caenarcaniphilales bacterium]|nr:hypothetical protein [Candidatus Caenarcaniphilales bacterium]
MDEKYKFYLYDLGYLIKERALDAKKAINQTSDNSLEGSFARGELIALYGIVTLMQQQAEGFQIPLSELQLDDIDPDKDLI